MPAGLCQEGLPGLRRLGQPPGLPASLLRAVPRLRHSQRAPRRLPRWVIEHHAGFCADSSAMLAEPGSRTVAPVAVKQQERAAA